ncbi:hypothetical protein GmHk_04G010433 [Glycine max]|nr:hypothetical protein GmHk_04G010433 [Glycine max]
MAEWLEWLFMTRTKNLEAPNFDFQCIPIRSFRGSKEKLIRQALEKVVFTFSLSQSTGLASIC